VFAAGVVEDGCPPLPRNAFASLTGGAVGAGDCNPNSASTRSDAAAGVVGPQLRCESRSKLSPLPRRLLTNELFPLAFALFGPNGCDRGGVNELLLRLAPKPLPLLPPFPNCSCWKNAAALFAAGVRVPNRTAFDASLGPRVAFTAFVLLPRLEGVAGASLFSPPSRCGLPP
jgi:hypothetical protein